MQKKYGYYSKNAGNKLQCFYVNTMSVELGEIMVANSKCTVCGNKIDISGIAPRLEGVKIFCRICGATSHHKF